MSVVKISLKQVFLYAVVALGLPATNLVYAQVLPVAELGLKISLAQKPTTRPMTVAYIPGLKRYYIADRKSVV